MYKKEEGEEDDDEEEDQMLMSNQKIGRVVPECHGDTRSHQHARPNQLIGSSRWRGRQFRVQDNDQTAYHNKRTSVVKSFIRCFQPQLGHNHAHGNGSLKQKV
jgi:hypothetical protein